jgi:hypothetical protein
MYDIVGLRLIILFRGMAVPLFSWLEDLGRDRLVTSSKHLHCFF